MYLLKARTRNAVLLLVVLLQALLSFHFLSTYFYLNEVDAIALNLRRPSVLDWKSSGETEIIKDSYLSFQEGRDPSLVKDGQYLPWIYWQGSESVFPIYIRPGLGGGGHVLARTIIALSSPAQGLWIFPFICGLLSFWLSLYYVKLTSKCVLGYALFSALSFHAIYYVSSSFQANFLILPIIFGVLILLERKSSLKAYVSIGLLSGLCLYLNLFSIFLLLAPLLIYSHQVRSHWKPIISGATPWLVIIFLGNIETLQGQLGINLVHPLYNVLGTMMTMMDYAFMPSRLFQNVATQTTPTLAFTWLALLPFLLTCYLIRQLTSRVNWPSLSFFVYFFILGVSLIARESEEPLMALTSLGVNLFAVIVFSRLDFASSKVKPLFVMAGVIALYCFQFASLISSYKSLASLNLQSKNCLWSYECVAKDLMNQKFIEEKTVILTLDELDVGQLEFFSKGKLKAIHASAPHGQVPSVEAFNSMLSEYFSDSFYVLVTNDASLFLLFAKTNYQTEMIKRYSFPNIGREHVLLKVIKGSLNGKE